MVCLFTICCCCLLIRLICAGSIRSRKALLLKYLCLCRTRRYNQLQALSLTSSLQTRRVYETVHTQNRGTDEAFNKTKLAKSFWHDQGGEIFYI